MQFLYAIFLCVTATFCMKDALNKEILQVNAEEALSSQGFFNSTSTQLYDRWSTIYSTCYAINSSLKASSILQMQCERKHGFLICEGGSLDAEELSISISLKTCPFVVNGGNVNFVNLTILNSKPFAPIPRLFCSFLSMPPFRETHALSLSDSSFLSFELASAPFLAPNASCFVKTSGLKMTNISIASGAQREMDLRARTETMIEGCSFFRVWDAIYGGILRSVNSPCASLRATNTSFECCFRAMNVNESGGRNMVRNVLGANETHIFTDCEWHDLNSENSGSAIYLNGDSTLECSRCSFKNLSHECDGAVDVQSAAGVKMTKCDFSNCIAEDKTGGMIIFQLKGDYLFTECVFCECKAIVHSVGGLRIYQSSGNENEMIEKCKFIRNEAGSFGGGLYMERQTNTFLISECEFEGNKANGTEAGISEGGGGGILLYSASWMETDPSPKLISFCLFSGNKAINEEGHDVKIKNSLLKGSPFESSFSTTPSKRVFYNNSQTDYDAWLPTVRTTYVKADGIEGPICGTTQTSPCNTIEQAYNMIEKGAEGTVNILRSTYSSMALFIGGGDISFKGESESECIISTKKLNSHECLFTLDSGSMGLSLVTIRHNRAESSSSLFEMRKEAQKLTLKSVIISGAKDGQTHTFDVSPFKVIFEKMKMENCLIEDIGLSDCSLFEEEEESGVGRGILGNVTIQRISRMRRDGVIFSTLSERRDSWELENTTFRNCVCKEGNGGSIAWRVDESGTFKIGRTNVVTEIGECGAEKGSGEEEGSGGGVFLELSSPSSVFEIVNVVFENNHAEHGVNVFITSYQLELVPKGRYGFVSLLSEKAHEVEGVGDTNNATLVIPIVCYLLDVPRSEIYVSSSGADHPMCGHTFFECRTLNYQIEREENTSADGTTTATIKVGNGVEVGSTVVFSKMARVIEGTGDDGSLVIGGEAAWKGDEERCIGVFVVLKETRMRKIGLVMPSVLEHHEAIFQLKGETLNLSECDVTFGVGVSYVGYSLLIVEKGEANVTSLRFASMRFGKPVIRANGVLSSVSLKNVELNDITFEGEMGFVVCEGGSTITGESVIISVCEMGRSSLICAGSNCIARMSECKWSLCNFVDSGIIKEVEAKEISIWGCNGSNVRVSDGDGGMMSGMVGEGGEIDLWNTSVEECAAEKGNGGGMMIDLKENAQLRIRSEAEVTLMKTCTAGIEGTMNGGGCGGGLRLVIEGERCSFDLSGVRFEENRARSGRDVFVVCDDLRRVVNGSGFSFSGEISERENSLIGKDRQKFVSEVDLFIFIDGYSSPVIEVESENGDNGIWCGMENCPCRSVDYGIGRFGGEGEKKIVISGSTSVEKVGDASGVRIEGKDNKKKKVVVKKGIDGEGESVLDSKGVSVFVNVWFELPGSFEQRKDAVISSSTVSGVLEMELCSFGMQEGEEEAIEYRIIRSCGQAVRMKWISINNIRTRKCLMDLALLGMEQNGAESESVSISNCSFGSLSVVGADESAVICAEVKRVMKIEQSNMSSITGGESMSGGAVRVNILDSGMIHVKEGMMERCSAEKVSCGKGGWMYVNCSERRGGMPFKFEGVKFAGNEAFMGKNMFILDSDLNVTVRNETFAIDIEGMEDDTNAFVGSDEKRMNTDLLRFVIEYMSERIVVWENGDDVVRCGSEEDPCETLEMGLKHIERGGERKVVRVKEKIRVEEEHDLSGIEVESVGAGYDEMEHGTVVLGSDGESGAKACLRNSGAVTLRALEMCVMNVFGSGESGTIVSEGGKVEWEDCSISWKGKREGMGDVAFCVVKKGELEMKMFKVLSYFGKRSAFVVSGEVVSVIDEFTVIEAKLESGNLFEIEGERVNGGGEMRMKNCSIGSVEGEGVDPCIISSRSESVVRLVVEDSLFEGCSCGRSTKGGAMLFELNEGGWFDVVNTSVKQCGCSVSEGKGGGVYLKTEVRGELDYVFDGVIFRRNTAKVGNDVFIVCDCIERQINETQFNLDFRDVEFIRQNAIYGMDAGEHKEEAMDLMSLIVKYQSDTIVVSNKEGKGGSNEQQCGKPSLPCVTIGFGLRHLTHDFFSQAFVDEESVIDEEIGLDTLTLSGMHEVQSRVVVKGRMNCSKEMIVETKGQVNMRWIQFAFEEVESAQAQLPTTHSSFMTISSGKTSISMCSFEGVSSAEKEMVQVQFCLIFVERGKCSMGDVSVSWLSFDGEAVMLMKEDAEVNVLTLRNIEGSKDCMKISGVVNVKMEKVEVGNVKIKNGWFLNVSGGGPGSNNREKSEFSFSILSSSFENITCADERTCVVDVEEMEGNVEFSNCSFGGCSSKRKKGKLMKLEDCTDVKMDCCIFDGSSNERNEKNSNTEEEEMCRWDGSLVDVVKSSVLMKDTTISNSPKGGITMSGGSVEIEKGEFINNNPSIEKYPSLRRNIICSDSGTLNVKSLKGGDGVLPNTSLWMLNNGCSFEGIVSERYSSFFIPVLESVEAKETTDRMKLTFKGLLLIPCNLSFSVVKRNGEEKEIEKHNFDSNKFLSEREVEGSAAKDFIKSCGNDVEVSVSILFGNTESPLSTNSFILKNRSVSEGKGDEKIAEGEDKIEWSLVAFIMCAVVVAILLFVIVMMVVVQRRKLKESEKRVEKERLENQQMMEKMERRRSENNGGNFEMSEMPSTLLEGMTSQIPLLIDNDEDLPEPPSMSNDEILNENDHPDLESPIPFSENASASGVPQSHSFNMMSAKKPFREKEKKNIKTLHSAIHSVQGNFTLGTRAMDVVDGKEVVLAVAELFEHLISVGDERMEMMARQLCPYSIFVEEGNENEIFVLTEELKDKKEKEEMKRWKAPEIGNEDEGVEKGVVFTLGLILHEMTTGEVPFSECIAEEAQEMMRDGVRPLTEGIEGEEMVGLMEKMWADEPDSRPTFGEVISKMEIVEN
ncbi:uncharacterized protein MONOS_5286 [Monocercomonoides exilis]|uniref:uncharacterized protein n=1 Tax=Monocercomonoides exilis TaxID=2049356 RepID=UPI00355ACB60|nr:hypothetical protein MONOS_5286 [Monocercomonoides exilis]|eukprot:MONOS_5286.1-p1 / transcript=MONOS_5286.1 / gene=MONOS_5286 / organism=Monocercomonoides_exilis_PA203 / gene_product=unspecified product / transcript_product=unspecified product / location=Mono_scaffold00152:29310-38003(-) / protein_length=2897 / sequence_SO=supercontig / SO=protein_coding / is_pseudo=false